MEKIELNNAVDHHHVHVMQSGCHILRKTWWKVLHEIKEIEDGKRIIERQKEGRCIYRDCDCSAVCVDCFNRMQDWYEYPLLPSD